MKQWSAAAVAGDWSSSSSPQTLTTSW